MYVIRRKPGESILIGDGIEIQVVDLTGARVKLGVVAPRQVRVRRKEVEQAARQNTAASHPAPPGALTVLRQILSRRP